MVEGVNKGTQEVTGSVPTEALVRELLCEQAPELAALPLRRPAESGSSNVVFRLGDELAVRLPRTPAYASDLVKEIRWLPRLAPGLSTPVPTPRFVGVPSPVFALPWSVVSWIPGRTPGDQDAGTQARLAAGLGRFVRELHRLDTGGEPAGDGWGYRCGEPVTTTIDGWARTAISRLVDLYDPRGLAETWRRVREVPPATGVPCWVHTDLSSENVLVDDAGRLSGVIDFGGLGIGDASVDLLYAWSLFDSPARERFRREAGADAATWTRARAWAFVGPGLQTLVDYRNTMPQRTARLRRMIEAIAAEVGVRIR